MDRNVKPRAPGKINRQASYGVDEVVAPPPRRMASLAVSVKEILVYAGEEYNAFYSIHLINKPTHKVSLIIHVLLHCCVE
jgi:hypothetical protein